MPLDTGSVVRYTSNYHDVEDDILGRICKRFGKLYFWVNFPDTGCIIVKETSLRAATGAAPSCDECP